MRSAETGVSIETYALVEKGAIRVPPDALHALGLKSSAQADFISLSDIAGLTVVFDSDAGEALLSCPSSCYRAQTIGGAPTPLRQTPSEPGAFLNVDLALSSVEHTRSGAGAFELGVFGPAGTGEASWTVGAAGGAEAVRLETRWTWDDPQRRVRLRFGDSIARPGATGAPYRFGGLQVARDFSLDPAFITFPTPGLSGMATAPSVVDLYVDGALRLREKVQAGPFEIVDPPILTGAGQVQLVVTDALGRQQFTSAPFYASRQMLKPGLTDFAFAIGALRERFAVESMDYGDGFAAGLYRRGMTDALTLELRGEAAAREGNVGAGLSWIAGDLGQVDLAIAASMRNDAAGNLLRAGFARYGRGVSLSADVEQASEAFARIGVDAEAPRLRAALSIGGDSRAGAASLSLTQFDYRHRDDVRTVALDYAPSVFGRSLLGLSLLYVEAETAELSLGMRLVRSFANGASVAVVAENRGGDWSSGGSVNLSPPAEGGMGWRASVRTGDIERSEAAWRLDTLRGVFEVEGRRVAQRDGVRAQAAFALAWMDGGLYAARPIRESFALVDVHTPDVRVTRDNRPAGVTDRNGRVLLTDLRAHESNRIGIAIDDLPEGASLAQDAILIAPGARAGVMVRFPVRPGASGEVRVLDGNGAPLPAGAMLVRENDGARFPVGAEGRVYVEGVTDRVVLRRHGAVGCRVSLAPRVLSEDVAVVCTPGSE